MHTTKQSSGAWFWAGIGPTLLLLTIGGCNGLSSITGARRECDRLVIDAPDGTRTAVGDSLLLIVGLQSPDSPCIGTNYAQWSVADGSIARVSSQNVVYGLAPGTTRLTATAGRYSAHISVTVFLPSESARR